MILVLNIISRQKAEWLVVKNKKIVRQYAFDLKVDQDRILPKLVFLLKKNKIKINQVKSLALLFQEASLTQVKVITAIINALAWQNNAKVYGDYRFSGQVEESIDKILKNVNKIKKFKPLKVIYSRAPQITISQKKHKFKISNK